MSAWFDEQGQLHGADHHTRQVWVPATQVLLTTVQVPGRQWCKALPWALEPQLLEPVDAVHIAVLHRARDGLTHCAVVSHARMRQWLAALEAAGCAGAALVPDCFQLPEEACAVAQREGDTLVRQGAWSGWRVAPALAEALQSQLSNCTTAALEPDRPALALSLRQGPYAPWGNWLAQLRQWRLATGVLAAFAVVGLVGYIGEAWQAERQAQAVRTATERLFHRAFGDHRLVDVRVQTEQLLQTDAPASNLWARLADLQAALTRTGVAIRQLRWRAWHLTVTVAADENVDWAQLRQALPASARLTVRNDREAQIDVAGD